MNAVVISAVTDNHQEMKTIEVLSLAIVILGYVAEGTCSFTVEDSSNMSCPTWLYLSEQGQCTCGNSLLNVILCNNISQEVSVQDVFCLTLFDQDNSNAVVGRCLYGLETIIRQYNKVDKNISQQNQHLCGYLNREGRLCGQCKHDHFVSPYSYDFKCYKCKRGLLSNIIMYLTVAYLPLTLFLGIVVFFHISVSTPCCHVAILMCQIYTLPIYVRVMVQVSRKTKEHDVILKILASLYGIWNLDFFRTLIPPICLPLNTMQVIALDYLVAVYPLLILVCVYLLVRAHDRGCRLVVRLWRPFLWCSARMRQQWNAKHSIIDAFATFILLSYIKFISVSADLLIPTRLYDIHGSRIGYFMFYDATVEFMSSQHMPFFIIALMVCFTTISFPLLLFFYPMNWFQAVLNKCGLNSPGLRMFMECFQGYYRDRSDGGWECRYFSACILH